MNWKTVYKTENPQRAEIVKSLLEEKDLHPILLNKKDSAYLFGLMEVQVNEVEFVTAQEIIEAIDLN